MTRTPPSVQPDPARVVGLDVAKASVTVHELATGRTRTVPNTPAALRTALAGCAEPVLVVCEATGGHERAALDAAWALGLPVHRADAGKVKAFVRSWGGRAKTDAVDARWLAVYGAERGAGLARWSPPDPRRESFARLVRLRAETVDRRTQVKNRRSAPGPGDDPAARFMDEELAFLERQIARLDREIADLVGGDAELSRDARALEAVKGLGPVGISGLLALLPELGTLTRRQAASLAGLAPHPRDSGQHAGRRTMTGGRAELRPVLFMASMSAARYEPDLKAFYERLLAAGKAKRLALAAVARKLVVLANALLRPLRTQPELT